MSFWEKIIRPLMFRLEAERAHEIGTKALKSGLAAPFYCDPDCGFGEIERFGLKFANPLGLAAGFDKNGVVVNQLASLGFGFVEVGTVTLQPQKGNPKPRVFRLPDDNALINRLGFNNDGAEVIAARLSKLTRRCVVGVNIGKNKDVPNEEAVENYAAAFQAVWSVADYVAVNVSSPNTPGLRELQKQDHLVDLLQFLQQRNSVHSAVTNWFDPGGERPFDATSRIGKPLLVKIAPDINEAEIEAVVDACLGCQIDGIIATNTTITRDGLKTQGVDRFGDGGLSGKPLANRSNEVISTIYRYSKGKLPIIGVGGIFTAEDAFAKIAAGASLLQAYTGFVYGGPTFARSVNSGLAGILKERGFKSIDEAVGSGA
jgi:dihydroorotate dehydrogenase